MENKDRVIRKIGISYCDNCFYKLKRYDTFEYIYDLLDKMHFDDNENAKIKDEIMQIIKFELNTAKNKCEDVYSPDFEKFIAKLNKINPELNPTQEQLCYLLYSGLSTKEIAIMLNKSIRTVENKIYSLSKILKPTDCKNMKDYIKSAIEDK